MAFGSNPFLKFVSHISWDTNLY